MTACAETEQPQSDQFTMPRDFYRVIDQVVRPSLEMQGFTRLKITSSAWIKSLGDQFVLLKIEKAVRHAYIKPTGGKFEVWFHLLNAPKVAEAHSGTCISFLRYQTDDDLLEMKRIRQSILRKILSQTKFESEFAKLLLDTSRPMMERSSEHNFNRRQPWPLEYLDVEDVATWAEFIASKVAPAFAGVSKEGNSALSYK